MLTSRRNLPLVLRLSGNQWNTALAGQVERVGDEPLRQILHSFGGWPVMDVNWSDTMWNLEELIGKLRGNFNAPILIESWVGADDKNSSVHILQVTKFWQ